MTQIVPLNKETHRALAVDGRASAAYGDNRRFVRVIVKEFPHGENWHFAIPKKVAAN